MADVPSAAGCGRRRWLTLAVVIILFIDGLTFVTRRHRLFFWLQDKVGNVLADALDGNFLASGPFGQLLERPGATAAGSHRGVRGVRGVRDRGGCTVQCSAVQCTHTLTEPYYSTRSSVSSSAAYGAVALQGGRGQCGATT